MNIGGGATAGDADFGAVLRSCREAAGLSQEQLAHASGVSVRTIGNLERGRVGRPYQDTLHRLADALDLKDEPRVAFIAAASRRTARGESDPSFLGWLVPRQLPPAVRCFTGRDAELRRLDDLLEGQRSTIPGAMILSAIGGTAGVGKTALAVHWAHRVTGQFPDGQLYVNLRGYDSGQPVPATDALAGFLRSLGVPGQDIPPGEAERTARYRSLLASRRVLVILDNACSADQVRPLLPGTPASTVLVTSRDALSGLVVRDGATRVELDALTVQEAIALLRTLIGIRVDAEPAAAIELAGQCCRLPLALRIAAELAATRPEAPLAKLTGELADQRTRLDLLMAEGDPRTQVRTVFSWSYRHLDAGPAGTFRLLGLHPGPDLDEYAATALTGATLPQTRLALEVLSRAHLVFPASPGRYGMHDLLRSYASELTASADTSQQRQAALTRLFDHYLYTAAMAMDQLFPGERHRRPRVAKPATPVPPLEDLAAARDWLDGELATLVTVAAFTAVHSWPGHATRLAAILAPYLYLGGHIPQARTILGCALDAARRTGDRTAEALALLLIGDVDWQQARFTPADNYYRQALVLFRAAGDRAGEARALCDIGLVDRALGRYEQAATHQQEAVDIYRDIGDRVGEARALGTLGLARQRQGRYQEAAGYHQQTLDLFRELGDLSGEAWALARLGAVDRRTGRYEHAARNFEQSLALFRRIGGTAGEAEVMPRLGAAYVALGRYEEAAENFRRALDLTREIGDPEMEADVLNGVGDLLCRTGDRPAARMRHTTALRLASQAGALGTQADAHRGLALAWEAEGDPVQARHHWQEALNGYDAIGAPEAEEVRARLAAAGPG